MERYYFHGTDLFAVSNILRDGLKPGHDGNIWTYCNEDVTPLIMAMLNAKKDWQTIFGCQGIEPLRWRSLVHAGMGVIKIDAKGITGKMIKDKEQQGISSKYLWGVHQSIIEPKYLSFIGGYNSHTQELQEIDILPYAKFYDEVLKEFDLKCEYIDLQFAQAFRNKMKRFEKTLTI